MWPLLLGPNRGRYFLLTGEEISAQQALDLNVVAEVLPPERLLPRAHELAGQLADKPVTTLRYTRVALTQQLKRHILDDLGYGLMLEGRAAIAMSDPATRAWTTVASASAAHVATRSRSRSAWIARAARSNRPA